MTVNKRFFEDLLRHRGLSLRQLAKRMDILPSQLSLTFSGKRRLQMAEAVKVAQILGSPLNEVLAAAGVTDVTGRLCKVTGILGGDGFIQPMPADSVVRVMMPDGAPVECSAIQARTAESPLGWMDGFVMFCNGEQPPEELVGRFARVKLEDGRELVATIRRGYTSGTFNLFGPVNLINERIASAHAIITTRH